MQKIARRAFLMSAGAAPLAFAWSGRAGANDRIRAAIIGMGDRGRDHIELLSRMDGVEIATFCDPDEHRMQEKAAEFEKQTGKKPKLEPDLRRVLDDRDIDVITIAAPNHWHALATIWACQAGKHVYVEKPIAHDMVEGRMMVEAARKHQRLVQGGTQRRSNGRIRKAIQALHDGVIGDIYMARCIHFQVRDSLGFKEPEAPPPDLHWDLWLGPGPEQPFHRNLVDYNWHWFWDFGNGELGNNGVHYMDVARWGLQRGLPDRIHSVGGRYGYKDQGQTPNTQVVTYEFRDGPQLVTEIRGRFSNEEAGMSSGVFFYGSKGYMAVSPDQEGKCTVFLSESKQPQPDLGSDKEGPHRDMQVAHFQNFFDAVRAGKQELLHADVNEIYLSTALALLGNISYRLDRKLTFDPAAQRFISDEAANQMLKCGHRSPYSLPEKV
jgi:predicted dehydrogenase